MNRSRTVFAFATLAVCMPRHAGAWGCTGHHIVARIAMEHLSVAARTAVEELLTAHPIEQHLARFCNDQSVDAFISAATWADDVKRAEGTGTWHYIDVPSSLTAGDLRPYCEPVGTMFNGTRPGKIDEHHCTPSTSRRSRCGAM